MSPEECYIEVRDALRTCLSAYVEKHYGDAAVRLIVVQALARVMYDMLPGVAGIMLASDRTAPLIAAHEHAFDAILQSIHTPID